MYQLSESVVSYARVILESVLTWLQNTGFALWSGLVSSLTTIIVIVVVLAAAFILKRLLFQRAPMHADLAAATHRPRMFGYATAAALIFSVSLWSALAPLASAAIAFGVVSPDGDRKTIAHLEGGIVRDIHVREGSVVLAGTPLVTLEDIRARSDVSELQERLFFLLGSRARLEAERDGLSEITFPEDLTRSREETAKAVMAKQRELLKSQNAAQGNREGILSQRIRQIGEQTAGLEAAIAAQDRQLALLDDEIANFETLLKKGLTQASRLSSLQRDQAALSAEKALNLARISENDQVVGETELQLLNLREERISVANDRLAALETQIAEVRNRLASRGDVLAKTVIRAPITGTVINLQATTVSGIVRPGQPILEIVPQDARLLVDARVRPTDIDRVHAGMEARIILSAYRQRNLPNIHGKLISVSADRLVEDRTGEPYFLAKIEVNPEDLEAIEGVDLIPGMPAEVMILNDERSFLAYLIDPLKGSFDRSFREE